VPAGQGGSGGKEFVTLPKGTCARLSGGSLTRNKRTE